MTEAASGPAQVVSYEGKGTVLGSRRKLRQANYVDSHQNIPWGGVRIWKSIILPSVKEDT